ncbi:unnamed protein product [Menidia menidia]|uniref:ATP-dependent DNA helicase Q4 n=1 Tax=Menidia menidia TaxID=238744 RepID=A0A8S4AQ57_9TELE|nr:unnamed protein product [Menidia menidia]
MDRCNEVKLLLKRWEQGFVNQHQRKPNKEDIDQAPEETRKLYKEYRGLKQAKENSSQIQAPADPHTTNKVLKTDSGCWGAHLNRKAMPVPAPRLTSQERDDLIASSQHYALKLKNNLASLGKDRPVSLKRSYGRPPPNSLKDEKTVPTNKTHSAETPAKARNVDQESTHINLGSASPSVRTLHPEEPEEQFKPLEPEPAEAVSSCSTTTNSTDSAQFNPTPLPSPSDRPSVLLSSLSPQRNVRSSTESPRASASDSLKTALENTDGVSVTGFKGNRPSFVGFGGGPAGRPSPARRLSCVDIKWLERCQVFGEMAAEEQPVAGNQEVRVEQKEREKIESVQRAEKEDKNLEGEQNVPVDHGGEEGLVCVTKEEVMSGNAPKSSPKHMRKGTNKRKDEEEIDTMPVVTPDGGNEVKSVSKGTRKRGKKREREEGQTEGDITEEGGAKKRRRNGKKKEESSVEKPESPDGRGQKKKRGKKKASDEEAEQTNDSKVPKKAPQENLFGELEEEFGATRMRRVNPVRARGAEGNFVKINLKRKSHVKGYALRGIALRKQMHMQKFQLKGERFGGGGGYFGRGRRGGFRGGFRGGISRQGDTCYKCGGTGHWAIDCKGRAPPPPVADDQPAEEEPFELPTLEDVARATGTLRPQPLAFPSVNEEQRSQEKDVGGVHEDEMLLNVIRPDYERPAPPPPMEPLYHLKEDGKVQETPDEVHAALRDLGYQSFRAGQEEAIMRILSGLSTLVVLSTGMGKSLCYQLPAYLYAQRSKCITLVISPLVSLMDDQLSGLPVMLKAACIHSNMSRKQREAAIEKVKSGQVCVLLLSPEALVGGGGSGVGCLPAAQELPPVAFACIDEAHCVSEWSHNFRPCYLRLCKVLRERLGVRCLLGLTATATMSTALDIAQHLEISDQDGIAVRSAAVPPNLNLSVSMDKEKDQALVSLLKGERFGCLDSIIVYCTRREETVRVAALLRTCLQGVLVKENKHTNDSQIPNNPIGQRKKDLARKKIRKPLKWQAESYHAGLSASERRRVQNNFMCGELRIVVATVAFGMGLDKSDVRGIIHYNMPKSFESYVQEIGRAGRDGEPAHCHLFLNPEGGDLHELRRHIYADTVDYYTVKRLVQKVFPACKCEKIHQKQKEIWKDVEDSELMEMIDVCDQESKLNCSAQHDEARVDRPAQISEPESAEPSFQEDGKRKENMEGYEKKEEDVTVKGEGLDWQTDQKVEGADWPEERLCHTHERAIPIQETVETLDITEEGVETLLCYLELHPQRFVELLHPTLSVCKVSCYDGPKQLQKITKICPPIAVVLARRRMAGERVERCDQLEFDVVEVADTMGWQLPLVKRGLRQLQWSTERAGGRSGVLVEFSSPSFYFRSFGDLSDEEMDRVCQFLHGRVQAQERTQLYQLTACFQAFKSVAFPTVTSCVDDLDDSRSLKLKNHLSEYFDKRRDRSLTLQPADLDELGKYKLLDWESQIRADIRSFLSNRSDEKFSGRAVARIFHGIGSPCYPAQTYGKDRRYWRKYIQFDFNQLIRLATQEIIHLK